MYLIISCKKHTSSTFIHSINIAIWLIITFLDAPQDSEVDRTLFLPLELFKYVRKELSAKYKKIRDMAIQEKIQETGRDIL